jgi:hypothetical protein
MGGDLKDLALFYLDDRVRTGDELHSECFDEPRVITRVDPSMTMSGVSHWEAKIVPLSEWKRLRQPAQPHVVVTGQGARVNLGSVDQSVQHFHNAADQAAAVAQVLGEIKALIEKLDIPAADKNDAVIDVDQLKTELQRSKPDKARLWTLVEHLNGIAGLASAVSKLTPLLQTLFS